MEFCPFESPWWREGNLDVPTPNTEAAVSIEEIKDYLKITSDDESAELLRSALSATLLVQGEIGRAITPVGFKLYLDGFPQVISLPYPPLLTPSSTNPLVKYIDVNGVEQTLASTVYQVHATQDAIKLTPAYGQSWPSTRPQFGAVYITYTAGRTQASIPRDIKTAVLWRLKLDKADSLSATELRETQGGYDRVVNLLRRVA